jgi:hypothetical protein
MANPIRTSGGRFGVMTKHKWSGGGEITDTRRLSTLIKDEFDREIEIDDCGEIFKVTRKQILADALAQMISTGRVVLPDTRDTDGAIIPGKHFDFSPNNWIKNVIMVLNYIDPPVSNVRVNNTVQSIIFDKNFADPKNEEVVIDEPGVVE